MEDIVQFDFPTDSPKIIKVIGVGGGGGNAVNHMYREGIHDVTFVLCNTDNQALKDSPVPVKLQLGKEGLGAGNRPARARKAAEESIEDIKNMLNDGTKMVFITAGMGGGTGTGAAPIIAQTAKEMDILTIGIVTIPFRWEGDKKIDQALDGVEEISKHVDALLVINNEKLSEIYSELSVDDAFDKADDTLSVAAKSIAEIITVKGYVNVDFADVESVMRDSGVALMGAAEAEGEGRAMEALTNALISPLLNSNDIRGASNILLNMLYGEKEVTMDEISLITDSLREKVGRNVNVIWGTGKDETLGDKLRVAVIATGFNNNRGRATAATEQKIETATTTSAKKPYFKVEPLPDDLEMKVMNPAELEEEARLRRQKQEEERARKQKRESNRRVDRFERSQRGVNEVPDTNGWLKRKIGTLFSDEE